MIEDKGDTGNENVCWMTSRHGGPLLGDIKIKKNKIYVASHMPRLVVWRQLRSLLLAILLYTAAQYVFLYRQWQCRRGNCLLKMAGGVQQPRYKTIAKRALICWWYVESMKCLYAWSNPWHACRVLQNVASTQNVIFVTRPPFYMTRPGVWDRSVQHCRDCTCRTKTEKLYEPKGSRRVPSTPLMVAILIFENHDNIVTGGIIMTTLLPVGCGFFKDRPEICLRRGTWICVMQYHFTGS